MGTGFIYDSWDVQRFKDKYMNPRLVTVAEIATMTGLPRLAISRKLRNYRQVISSTEGNRNRRIGALYDLDNPVIKHLFSLWGWDEKIKERTQDNDGNQRAAESDSDGTEPTLPDAGLVHRDVKTLVRRRTRSELGR